MVAWFYLIVFLISVIMTGSILAKNRKEDNVFILFSVLLAVNCGGNYILSVSETVETAIWANKIMYIGGCYLPFVVFLIVTRLCGIKTNRFLQIFLLGYATIVLGFVMTIGHTDWYYKSVELVQEKGVHYLIKEYGTFQVLYPVMIILYSVLLISCIVYAIIKRKEIPTRAVVTMSFVCAAVFLIYIFERLLGANISYLPVGYIIGMLLLMGYFDRINMYDISAGILSSVEKLQEYGYVVIDNKCRYVNANENAKKVFPEIRTWIVDKAVPASEGCLYQNVIRGLLRDDDDIWTERLITVGERCFQVDVRELTHGKKTIVGFLIEFVDKTAERNYYNAIEAYNTKLEKEVEEKTEHITYIKDMMVLGMAELVESRDDNTGGHIKRTSEVVRIFAEQLSKHREQFGLTKKFLKLVIKAAPMHDLGKIAIDDAVLRKPEKYTDAEYTYMKGHAEEGALIVEEILRDVEDDEFVQVAKNVALYHHERWDGKGYPTGKAGEDIPVEARIMALADVFDALVSKRCYKEALSYDSVFEMMEASLGQHFDPALGSVFLECRDALIALYEKNKQ